MRRFVKVWQIGLSGRKICAIEKLSFPRTQRKFDAMIKKYKLIGPDGVPYLSMTPGTFGGHKKLKIYGKLDCPSTLRYIAKGQYVQHRVFFANEADAIAAGYRPCGDCMKEANEQ